MSNLGRQHNDLPTSTGLGSQKEDDAKADGPCERGKEGVLSICTPLLKSLSGTSVGIQDFMAVTFATGKTTIYVGVRRSRRDKVMLFNVCPFCRFEFKVKDAP